MSYAKTWSGDWHGRILERVRQRDFETATEYVSSRPGVSLVSLAEELGPDDVAAAQLRSVLLDEAERSNTVSRLLCDLLVRELRDRLPEGWKHPRSDDSRFRAAAAIAAWTAEFRDLLDQGAKLAAGKAFLDAELPTGWLPEGPDDPVIAAFVDRCLGRQPS
jgi:hypothetical protein